MSFFDGWYQSARDSVSGTIQAAESSMSALFRSPHDTTNQSVDPADEAKYGHGVTSETVRILKATGTEPLIPVTVYGEGAPSDSASAAVAAAWARWAQTVVQAAGNAVKPIVKPFADFASSTLTKVLIGVVVLVIGITLLYGISRKL